MGDDSGGEEAAYKMLSSSLRSCLDVSSFISGMAQAPTAESFSHLDPSLLWVRPGGEFLDHVERMPTGLAGPAEDGLACACS